MCSECTLGRAKLAGVIAIGSTLLILLFPFGVRSRQRISATSGPPATVPGETLILERNRTIEREMKGGARHRYQINLSAGQFLRAVVVQRGIDLVVTLYGPNGRRIAEIDSPNGAQGPEPVAVVAQASGAYRLEVRPFEAGATAGRYTLRIVEILTAKQYAVHLAAERTRARAATLWLARNAIRLRTVEADRGFSDMQPLKQLVGRARVVALGEATHGTREFFQFKHRMLEFLVSEMGFTLFGIEATMPEALDINEYVLTGRGDPEKALAGLYFWTWNTEEVLALIRWMRQYNADPRHRRKVKFYGFDMQYTSRAVRVLLDYLRRVDPEEVASAREALAPLSSQYIEGESWKLPKERKEAMASFLSALLHRFDARKLEYLRNSAAKEWAQVRQHARILAQFIGMQRASDGGAARDRAMAENIRWILDQEGPKAKIVLWAHNAHVAKEPGWMGSHLQKWFGPELLVIGFAFYQGAFQAIDTSAPIRSLRVFRVGPAPEGSLDATLAAAGVSAAVIDLRALPRKGAAAEWLRAPRGTRGIGAVYSSDQNSLSSLPKEQVMRRYDALFFVRNTSAARALPAGRRPAYSRLTAPANLDFEDGVLGVPPPNWVIPAWTASSDYQVVTTEENPRRGARCAVIRRSPGHHYGERYGSLAQRIAATAYRGKKVRWRAAVRTKVTGPGNQAHLWLRITRRGPGGEDTAFEEKTADRPITSSEWRDYEITSEAPADAETIEYGLALIGDGAVWLDSVSLEGQ